MTFRYQQTRINCHIHQRRYDVIECAAIIWLERKTGIRYQNILSKWLVCNLTTNITVLFTWKQHYLDRVKRIWYLSPMRAAKVQANLRMRAVSPEPSLLAHTSSESRGTFRQNARSLAPLNGWASAVKICHEGTLEDTNSLDGAHLHSNIRSYHNDSTLFFFKPIIQLSFVNVFLYM